MENFYVYEWFNVDTKEVFYVGKGHKDRYKNIIQRNKYFKNYYNKYNCDVRKIKEGLTEQEAFDLEKKLIEKYRVVNQCQCNLLDGGSGGTSNGNLKFSLLRKLTSSPYYEREHSELYDLTVEELVEEDMERAFNKQGYDFLNALDIYDDEGNLNIGWECFED